MWVLEEVSFLCKGDIQAGISSDGTPCNYKDHNKISDVAFAEKRSSSLNNTTLVALTTNKTHADSSSTI